MRDLTNHDPNKCIICDAEVTPIPGVDDFFKKFGPSFVVCSKCTPGYMKARREKRNGGT